ncbi:FadR/GntR family transcriptional regulator [Rhizobium sp.]|jgi:GntR family transcriptional regulator, transcriptional repressor for pyruvate dehydrogenase complex|uniref:FadR/GntR family transcriptional regulator n=1 Tax=Rhizobium sp. TaxID=391 RepID=UPI000E90CF3C|nr:GntR family transcriptional regulator [Rhizobium sp.]
MSQKPETRRLYQQVADQIRQFILDGDYGAGTRLPSERDLAQQLGVSRPSLREALIALEIDGTVEIRMGSGVYVAIERENQSGVTLAFGESPSELMQARIVIEGSTTLLAASRIQQAALANLRSLIEGMRTEITEGRRPLELDRQFHLLIVAQSGNSVLERIVGSLFDERYSPLAERLQDRTESQQSWIAAVEEHEAILAALEAHDPLLSQAAMQTHLDASRRRWTEG